VPPWWTSGFAVPISAMSRDDVDLGDPATPPSSSQALKDLAEKSQALKIPRFDDLALICDHQTLGFLRASKHSPKWSEGC
jgi:hypothetical protein